MKKFLNLAVAVVMLAMAVGCTRIGPGYVGIKVNNAGSSRGVQNAPVLTGWVFYTPGQSTVIEYPVFVQTMQWSADINEGNKLNEEIVFTNKDKMSIRVDSGISYHLDGNKVPQFYSRFHTDDLTDFTNGYLHNVARNCYNEHGGKYDIDQIMGDNGPFFKDVQECIQKDVSNEGVVIDQFGPLKAPIPPQSVLDAINAASQAKQKAIQIQNELAQTTAEAAKKVALAEGDAKAQLTRAKAQADANNMVQASINDKILEQMRLNNQHDAIWRWNGSMPETVVGGAQGSPAGMLLNLSK